MLVLAAGTLDNDCARVVGLVADGPMCPLLAYIAGEAQQDLLLDFGQRHSALYLCAVSCKNIPPQIKTFAQRSQGQNLP